VRSPEKGGFRHEEQARTRLIFHKEGILPDTCEPWPRPRRTEGKKGTEGPRPCPENGRASATGRTRDNPISTYWCVSQPKSARKDARKMRNADITEGRSSRARAGGHRGIGGVLAGIRGSVELCQPIALRMTEKGGLEGSSQTISEGGRKQKVLCQYSFPKSARPYCFFG